MVLLRLEVVDVWIRFWFKIAKKDADDTRRGLVVVIRWMQRVTATAICNQQQQYPTDINSKIRVSSKNEQKLINPKVIINTKRDKNTRI